MKYKRLNHEFTKHEVEIILKILEMVKKFDANSSTIIEIKGYNDELRNIIKKSIKLDNSEQGNWIKLSLITDIYYEKEIDTSIININCDIIDYINLLENELKKIIYSK